MESLYATLSHKDKSEKNVARQKKLLKGPVRNKTGKNQKFLISLKK